jgi:hypothetical protein
MLSFTKITSAGFDRFSIFSMATGTVHVNILFANKEILSLGNDLLIAPIPVRHMLVCIFGWGWWRWLRRFCFPTG